MSVNRCFGCMAETEQAPCPQCGFDPNTYETPPHHLPLGTVLQGQYLLGRAIGEGGFGITYIGWDTKEGRKAAVKEFYPNGFVTRESAVTRTVQPFTGEPGEYFRRNRDRFVEEAQRLAKFGGMPGIVEVWDHFTENGTAYIVMEYVDGQTFKQYLGDMGGKLPPLQVLEMMQPVMESLAVVHREGLIHRDISPDNIMITRDGVMKLIDFGAAREFDQDGNKSLSVMLRPGYAPEEQYRRRGTQGPWTDIYALCATMYRALTGQKPEESVERLRSDTLKAPSALGVTLLPAQEASLLKGMAVLQENRIQDMATLAEALKPVYPVTKEEVAEQKEEKTKPPKKKMSKKLLAILAGALVAVLGLGLGIGIPFSVKKAAYKAAYEITDAYFSQSGTIATGNEDYDSLFYLWLYDDTADVQAILTEDEIMELREIHSGWDRKRMDTQHQEDVYQSMQDFAAQVNARLADETQEESQLGEPARTQVTEHDYTFSSGSTERKGLYTGWLEDGLAVCDNGSFESTDGYKYTGEWAGGVPSGKGKATYPNGIEYDSEFKDGSPNGQGTVTNPYGETYVGGIKNGRLEGQGTFTFANGEKYVGEFKDNKMNGQGILYDSKGTIKQQGEWKDDKYVGGEAATAANARVYVANQTYGYDKYSNGTYTGYMLNGRPDGKGKYEGEYPDGSFLSYDGDWKNGMEHGQGKQIYSYRGGHIYEGAFRDGEFHGQGTYFETQGDEILEKFVGTWEFGNRNGYGTLYSADGKILQQGEWKYDEFVG